MTPQTDDVKHFEILIGKKPVTFSQEDLAKLKGLELGAMEVWEGIQRNPRRPDEPLADFVNDWIRVEMELGKKHKVQWKENGITKYHLGKSKLTIMIVKGMKGSIHVSEFRPPS